MVSARDELPHQPGGDPHWEESWELDFVAADGRLGGYVRLAFRPGDRQAWYWAAVVGPRRPLVAVRDHDVDMPRGRALEVRASGLWAQLVCETPLDHWSTGLEAFAVGMEDPVDAYGDEWGQPVALGLDLEWEAAADCWPTAPTAYVQVCTVHGDVLVGAERLAIDGHGSRTHRWGPLDWGAQEPTSRLSGRLDDGIGLHAGTAPGADGGGAVRGFMVPTGGSSPVSLSGVVTGETADDGLLRRVVGQLDGMRLTAEPLAHAPVGVPLPGGRQARVAKALVRVEAEGRTGSGWAESVGVSAG